MPLNASALEIGAPGFRTLIQADRQLISGIFGNKSCVLNLGDFNVTSNATSHAVDIAAGKAAIAGTNASDQGSYFAWSESSETLAWPVPSTSPRIDTLVLRIADPQYGTVNGNIGARWDIIQGTPAATPVSKSDVEINRDFFVPGAWLRIANIRVNVNDTGVIPGGQISMVVPARNVPIVYALNLDAGSTTSLTATSSLSGATGSPTQFTAPLSGKIEIEMSCSAWLNLYGGSPVSGFATAYIHSVANNNQWPSFTSVGEKGVMQLRFNSTYNGGMNSKTFLITNLIPGATYEIEMRFHVAASGNELAVDDRTFAIKSVIE